MYYQLGKLGPFPSMLVLNQYIAATVLMEDSKNAKELAEICDFVLQRVTTSSVSFSVCRPREFHAPNTHNEPAPEALFTLHATVCDTVHRRGLQRVHAKWVRMNSC